MKKEEPLVSVIMGAYKSGPYLAEAIESVLKQTYTNWELFVINDGSTDETEEVAKAYKAKDPRIHYLKNEKNSGQSATRNKGIEQSKGKYIIIMDSDDISLPERLKKQVEYMEAHPEIGVLGTMVYAFSGDDPNNRWEGEEFFGEGAVPFGRCPVHNPTTCIRKEILDKYGAYNSRYDNAEDHELWFRLYSKGVKFYNLKDRLYLYRQHSTNNSTMRLKKVILALTKVNLLAIFRYRIRFNRHGYARTLEHGLYYLYLALGLNKILQRRKRAVEIVN